MALTRNQQRAAAKHKRELKLAQALKQAVAVNKPVRGPMMVDKQVPMSRDYERATIGSCMVNLKGQSHRAYVCQNAKGSVDKRK